MRACEDNEAVRSGTPKEPELKAEELTETPKAPVAKSTSDIVEETETCAPTDDALHNFKWSLDGGLTFQDAAIDKDNVPLVSDTTTDVEDELELKLYKDIDPLSPFHFACHLPKCAGCPA